MRMMTLIALAASCGSAGAGTLYGLGTTRDEPAVIYEIDPATGAATAIVTLGASASVHMGLTSLGGELYATLLQDEDGFAWLGRINLVTGDVAFVRTLGDRLNSQGLASNESTGELYSVSRQIGSPSQLFSYLPDGTSALIGETGIAGQGLAYDDGAGVLYGLDVGQESLFTIDTGTGVASAVGPLDIGAVSLDFSGLALDEAGGSLFLNDGVGGGLYSIDTTTGGATLIGANGTLGISGLAWVVPAPGGVVTLVLAPILTGRRRR